MYTIEFDQRSVKRYYDQVHNAAVDKALPSALNRALGLTKTRVKRRIAQKTGVAQKQITGLIRERKASRNSLQASMTIRAKTPNAIRFGAKEQRRALSHRSFRKVIKNKTGFIGNSGRTAFRREPSAKRLPIRPVYGPNVARAFGAPKNMAVYQRFARIVLAREFNKRLEDFSKQIKRKRG